MILILEQDIRCRNAAGELAPTGHRFTWRPLLFRGPWHAGRTLRIAWGVWSLTYFPEEGLKDFLDHVEQRKTQWAKLGHTIGRIGVKQCK